MALIKQSDRSVAAREAIVLNLGDLRREADRMREEAEASCARMLAEAKAERARILEGASEEGYEAGYREGYAKGVEQGAQDGSEKAYAEASERAAAIESSIAGLFERIEQERDRMLREAKDDVLLFACSFAERVTKRAIELDDRVAPSQLEASLKLVLDATGLRILVHPADREACDRVMPVLSRERGADGAVRFEEDETLTRGSVVIRTKRGMIDASIDGQIGRIIEGLIGEARLEDRIADAGADGAGAS